MSLLVRLLVPPAALVCFVGQTLADPIPNPRQIPQLIDAFDDENVQYGASIALAQLGTRAVPALRQSLASDSPNRRVWAAYTLGEIGPAAESAVGELTKTLADSADSAFRAAAAQALGKIGPASAPSVGALADLLSDSNVQVREQSAVALGQIGPRASKAAPQLIAALKHSKIRQSARTALIQIGESAVAPVQDALDDDHRRFDVSLILREVSPQTAKQRGVDRPTRADVTSLRLVLRDLARAPQDRAAAASALASLGEEGVVILIEAFEVEPIAATAVTAFAKASPAGVPPLIDALAHKQPGVRAAAADALGHVGPAADKAVPHLVGLFKDRDHEVRYHAVRALDAFGQKAAPAVPGLIELMLDSQQREPARQWAIMTLVNTLPETHHAVVEALIKASRDKGNYGVSSLARLQLRKIDLKAAEAAGIRR